MGLLKFLHELFDKPRCDKDVCLRHSYRVHFDPTGRAYVPMNLVVKSHMKKLKVDAEKLRTEEAIKNRYDCSRCGQFFDRFLLEYVSCERLFCPDCYFAVMGWVERKD
jgi:late competence protein required for DNA uptake (superfamily II DNA/RNA helicase)